MVDAINGNNSVQYPDDRSNKTSSSKNTNVKTILIPIVGRTPTLGEAVALGISAGISKGIAQAMEESRALKEQAQRYAQEARQYTIDYAINGADGQYNAGTVESQAELDKIADQKAASLKENLEKAGYRYGTSITVTGGYKEPGRSVTSYSTRYVQTSYEEKVQGLKSQGFTTKGNDKFTLKDNDNNHSATLNIEGYDTVTVKDEVIDNRNDENKNYDAVKGSKLGKADGEPQMTNENTVVQKYQNGTVVETAYDNAENPNLTITTTKYPDGSMTVKTETKVPLKYGIGSPDSNDYVDGVLNSGTITEQFTPDGELVYRKTKGS